jgi:hypothetical protein
MENNTRTELWGITGVDEHQNTVINLFGSHTRPEVVEAQKHIGSRYGWTLTAQNAAEVVKAIEAAMPALVESRPVSDNRQTPDERATRDAENARFEREREAKARAERQLFLGLYGNGETVTVPSGSLVVTAQLTFDDSDSMSDYFHPHAPLGPAFALLVAREQPKTEALARRGLAVSESLSKLAFTWHTENWSMGHGNYLQSEGFELPAELQGLRDHYRGGPVTHASWEIQFSEGYRKAREFPAIRGYGLILGAETPEEELARLRRKLAEIEASC